jgi:hypothetical protein
MVDTTFLDASGMPHSDELRLTERYWLQDGGRTLRVEAHTEAGKRCLTAMRSASAGHPA